VCPVGAIQAISKEQMRLGLAQVDRRACLAWDQGARCLVCVEGCPTGAAVPHQGRVTVDPLKCTGCGICEQVCPVAGGAIHVTLENEVRVRRGEVS
jgi:formate hydrogenlyase subunit 6/NADH:ubiquinone oxidoreductase subunit I